MPASRFTSLKNQVNRLLTKSGRQIIHQKTLERYVFPTRYGLTHLDFRECLSEIMRDEDVSCCFDVGANIGQTATKFRSYFPQSTIYCFEPVANTFEILKENMTAMENVYCLRYAVSSESEQEVRIYLHPDSQCNSLGVSPDTTGDFEVLESITVDDFRRREGIQKIDLLKSDTEGFDLEVLKGARETLCGGHVNAVYVEVCFDESDQSHSNFFKVAPFLEECGLSFFGLFEQSTRKNPHRLFYANALFLSRKLE